MNLNINSPLFLFGTCFFIAGWLLFLFPPKKVNSFYGYKTASSMQSQEKWDFSQKLAAKILIVLSLMMIGVSMFSEYIMYFNILEHVIIVVSILFLIVFVEYKLLHYKQS